MKYHFANDNLQQPSSIHPSINSETQPRLIIKLHFYGLKVAKSFTEGGQKAFSSRQSKSLWGFPRQAAPRAPLSSSNSKSLGEEIEGKNSKERGRYNQPMQNSKAMQNLKRRSPPFNTQGRRHHGTTWNMHVPYLWNGKLHNVEVNLLWPIRAGQRS